MSFSRRWSGVMMAPWVVEEMRSVDLKDARLNKRLAKLLSDLGGRPTLSIPAACGGHTEMTAAYRFFDNDKASFAGILAPHRDATLLRAQNESVVLLVPDTTEIDLTRPAQQVTGAGPLATAARCGLHLHAMEAFTPDGTPLGEVWSHVWTRDPESLTVPQKLKKKTRQHAPIQEKESFRWLDGLRHAREFAQQCPQTACVYVADSEADIYELYAEARGQTNPIDWVIRLCHDRALAASEGPSSTPGRLIRDQVKATAVLWAQEISVRGRQSKVACDKRSRRQPRADRKARVEVRATTVTLRPPWRADRKLPEVRANVVLVSEVNPPVDDVAVEWLLITTLPIACAEDVKRVIRNYTVRWMIEIVFRTLKSGCRIENRRLETAERIEACPAVYLIVAWRTLFVCRVGRGFPEMDCQAVFEPSEWKSVWVAVTGKPLPQTPPPLNEMVRLIAQLGGYVNRPNRDDPPGPQTVWIGLQRMHDLAWAWNVFGPGAPKRDL
jgi:hypothetical protein